MWGTGDRCAERLPRRHRRHEQTKSPAQNKNVKLMPFIWPSAGLCPRLPDCVRSLHKHEDSITAESWSLHNTSKTTGALTLVHSLHPLTGLSVQASHAIPLWLALDGGERHPSRIKRNRRANRLTGKEANSHVHIKGTKKGLVCLFFAAPCYLVKVNNWFRMDADKLQARSVALEELRKQPEKDGPHLLVLEKRHTCAGMSYCALILSVSLVR